MRRIMIFFNLAACGLVLAGVGCNRGTGAPDGSAGIPPSKVNIRRNVQLSKALQQPLVYTVETVGLIEAEGETQLAAGVTGNLDEVNFREGDIVSPDDILVRISVPLYDAAVKVAEAELVRAENRAKEAQENLDLVKERKQSVSRTEFLQREIAVAVANADVKATEAALERAKYNRRRSELKPPYRGRINKRFVTRGSYVDEKAVIGTMADLSRLRLTTYIPETATSAVRELLDQREKKFVAAGYDKVPWFDLSPGDLPSDFDPEFTVLPFPQHKFKARIFYLSTVGDPSTHQFECKAEIVQPKEGPRLLPGFTARIRIPLKTKLDAVLVHEECLRSTERGWLVFVPESRAGKDGKREWLARSVRVEPGYRANGMVEILSGLKGDELVIRKGADALEEEGGTPIAFSKEEEALLK